METRDFLARLQEAVKAHDLDALVECFEPDYRNETPAHPERGFEGRDQVRVNWQRLLAGMPDLRAEVVRSSVDGDVVWSEWQMSGTRPDTSPHLLCGVIIFGVRDGRAAWARFYMEPVESGGDGVDAAISRIIEPERSA